MCRINVSSVTFSIRHAFWKTSASTACGLWMRRLPADHDGSETVLSTRSPNQFGVVHNLGSGTSAVAVLTVCRAGVKCCPLCRSVTRALRTAPVGEPVFYGISPSWRRIIDETRYAASILI
jgi:hypothetical protein